jgi:putative Mg2+ transporter-C (MgtC) family protein
VWPLIVGGLSLAMLVLFVGAPLERRIRDRARLTPAEADRKDVERKP